MFSCSVVSALCDPMDCSPPDSSVHGDSPGTNTRVGCHALLQRGLPNPGIEAQSPTLQADSLPFEPPGKTQVTQQPRMLFSQSLLIGKDEVDC